jgi:chorismate mutase/prephenate dehydratase
MSKQEKELEDLRENINEIDDNIIELLNERGKIVKKVSNIKKILRMDVHQPHREKEIIDRIKSRSTMLKETNIESIWKEILGACKAIQGSILQIGYLGPQGTNTHQAALGSFPEAGSEFVPLKTITSIFEHIEREKIEFGVVPIENSLQGIVRETLDNLIEKNIFIYGELELKINQNLICLKDANLDLIKTIYSHPQAFAQTRNWIKTNLPNAELITTSSTSAAVQKIRDLKDVSSAAIGTTTASKIYSLKELSSNIEDASDNFTRFLVISGKENDLKEEKLKTSIVYVTKHVPGALYKVLKIFADADINLTKIESRPRRKGRWEYIFLMDFEGDKKDDKIIRVLEEMTELTIWHKILGSYPMS